MNLLFLQRSSNWIPQRHEGSIWKTTQITKKVINLWWTLQSAICHLQYFLTIPLIVCSVVKSVVNAHANVDIFQLFLFILVSCTSFTMGVFTQHVLNEAYSHYTRGLVPRPFPPPVFDRLQHTVQPHLFVYATFAACLLHDSFRVCRGPASVNCWEVLTVATGYSPELGYKPEIMASSLENDQFVAAQQRPLKTLIQITPVILCMAAE